LGSGVEISHACGGICACATCHVYVVEGERGCFPPEDAELDMLDKASSPKHNSRLGCQCIPTGDCDIIVEIPD
jgi:2Fe-2S ferredoxin